MLQKSQVMQTVKTHKKYIFLSVTFVLLRAGVRHTACSTFVKTNAFLASQHPVYLGAYNSV